MLCEMLELEGYTVLEASDGDEGIWRQSEQPADLIIVDVMMPDKDGIDTMLEIKDTFPDAKFIVVSGESGYIPKAKLGMAEILGVPTLRKPFERKKILETIEQLQN
ncbi:MAG: response regulator [Deltaproteobacteria bacterium]|nr:MAG: response regulator [Deltaproteobacteria bacterium]